MNIALPRMANDDDVLTFFNTFERLLQMHDVNKAEWSMRLFPQITAKAQKALRGQRRSWPGESGGPDPP